MATSSSSSFSLKHTNTRIVSQNSDNKTVLKQRQSVIVLVDVPAHISRRCAVITPLLSTALVLSSPLTSFAREKRSRKNIPIEEYLTTSDGLKYYDLAEGRGPVAVKGSTVQVHFDCVYRGITAVSSRESKLLAGNRIIAQPYQFQVGSTPGRERKRDYADKANGLFSAQAAPKPPPALYSIVEGMKVGGKRTVIVPPEVGYGNKGSNEIPPGATFDLNIELLQVQQPEGNS
ncbi:hypothetical protein RND81_01G110700 [Saponaria officinalis]|uniref:peptidylprolyl isomerase n=1 Tax=Saponaria officinalis TaxID=3572 RepID=A0AAW1NE59_SAPOF